MKKLLNVPVLAIIGIALIFTACDKDNENDIVPVVEYPSLKLVNETTHDKPIYYVRLVGYEFTNLNIGRGESQTFVLDKGMSGGYEDLYVTVGYKRYSTIGAYISTTVDFYKGEITTITLKGYAVGEGSPGISLE